MTQEQNKDTFIEKKMEEFRENIFEVSKIRPLGKEYPYRLQKEAKDWIENFLKSSLQEQREAIKNKIMELVAYSSFEMNGSEPRDRNCTVREAMLELFEDIKHLLK